MLRLDVTVTDTSGKPLIGLKPQDFTLRDNGQPTTIVSFQAFDGIARPDPPVEVILVIDEWNMPEVPQHGAETLLAAEHEAENFLRQNHGNLHQPVLIYRLTRDGLSASPQPSTDGNELADEIANRRETRVIWKTPAVAGSMGDLARAGLVDTNSLHSLIALGSIAIEARHKPGRKLMFWLGNGWQIENNGGTGAFDFLTELSTRLREARINLWSANEWPSSDPHGNPVPSPLLCTRSI
jgi:VWFA-related protein